MNSSSTFSSRKVKAEILEQRASGPKSPTRPRSGGFTPASVINLSSSESDSEDDPLPSEYIDKLVEEGCKRVFEDAANGGAVSNSKKATTGGALGFVRSTGFLSPLPPEEDGLVAETPAGEIMSVTGNEGVTKQFWKAGDYEGDSKSVMDSTYSTVGMDHSRVHPKFLHSNATSHKWALGAFAELLDNALDEVCNGARYVNIDVLSNKKDESKMLLIEDNGGGMDPDTMRQCVSFGYSAKSKMPDTIGQYGNGFKTSTMRLGADVIVFSRSCGKDKRSLTQSIGLLSFTFLRSTGKEDIVVPMLDYERVAGKWHKMMRSTPDDWQMNVDTIVQWSPFSSEEDLLRQFNLMKLHGTRIIIYNLWENDEGLLELDFDADNHDIQLRGVSRDERSIEMAQQYPNSRHFLTYRHSLRSYASILYLSIPPGFRIILRGKDVEHHNIVNDMMLTEKITYRPTNCDGIPRDMNMAAIVTIGFVKDAKHHIDVQGFNVYHKNRLIKPFWRLWHAAGSDGRGVIGVLEANFVEPAHDKQGFERTTVLARLEARLVQVQKQYWSKLCHKIGYAPRRNKKHIETDDADDEPPGILKSYKKLTEKESNEKIRNQGISGKMGDNGNTPAKLGKRPGSSLSPSPSSDDESSDHEAPAIRKHGSKTPRKNTQRKVSDPNENEPSKVGNYIIEQLRNENRELNDRLKTKEAEIGKELQSELEKERERSRLLETQLQEAHKKIEELNKEQENLINIFSEERDRRDAEEENLRNKLKDASKTIHELVEKVRRLENVRP